MHEHEQDLMRCKCGLCNHDSRRSCIEGRCYCCDLEDIFAVLSHIDFEPHSRLLEAWSCLL